MKGGETWDEGIDHMPLEFSTWPFSFWKSSFFSLPLSCLVGVLLDVVELADWSNSGGSFPQAVDWSLSIASFVMILSVLRPREKVGLACLTGNFSSSELRTKLPVWKHPLAKLFLSEFLGLEGCVSVSCSPMAELPFRGSRSGCLLFKELFFELTFFWTVIQSLVAVWRCGLFCWLFVLSGRAE